MPFEITKHRSYMLATFSGVLTAEDLTRLGDEVEIVEDSVPVSMDRITDLTHVEKFEIGFPAVSNLAERRKKRVFTRPVRSALIAREPVQVGLARMFQTLNDNPMIEVQLFRSIEEAETWFARGKRGEGDTGG